MISPPLPPFPRTLPAQLNPVHFNLNIIITIVIIVTTIVVIIILIAIVIVMISPVDDVHRWKGGQEILLDLLLPPRLRPLTIVQIMMVMVMVMVLVMVVVNDHGMSTCCYPEGSSPTENSLQRCSCLSKLISFIVLLIIFTTCIIIFIMIFIIVIMITTFRMIISSSALMALEDFFRSCAEFGLLVGTAARALSPFFAKSKSYF